MIVLFMDGCISQQQKPKSSLSTEPAQEQENSYWINFNEPDIRNCMISYSLDSDWHFNFQHLMNSHQALTFFILPASLLLPEEAENFELPAYSSRIETHESNSNYYAMLYDQGHLGMPIEADSNLTVAQQQKFTIYEISPEWGYATEVTKVRVIRCNDYCALQHFSLFIH